MPIQPTQSADLDQLALLIEHEKCALVLGPLASCDAQGRPLRHLLAREIAADFQQKMGFALPEPDNLALSATAYLQRPNSSRTALEIIVRDFYKRHTEPSAILKEASKLPFRLIFTAAHDELLQKAFLQTRRRQACTDFYRFAKTQSDHYENTPEGQTFLFQLFGRVADKPDGSLVLTVGDQLAFIDSIQGPGKETHLPAGLRRAMLECEAFLFVGFDYENWYLKVLFHILHFSDKARLVFGLPEGRSAQMQAGTEEFFRHQYKFSFLPDHPLTLLENLRQRIDSSQNTPATPPENERSLLFLHHPNDKDEAIRQRISRQLANVKRTHGLRQTSIHDFESGETSQIQARKIAEASAIILLLSADFLADDALVELAERAISQSSETVIVAAVYARETAGVADFLQNRIPVFPAKAIPLSRLDEDSGAKKVAEMLESLIQILPKP